MKKLLLVLFLTALAGSCTQNKEKLHEERMERSAEGMRNQGVDSAAVAPEHGVPTTDSTTQKK